MLPDTREWFDQQDLPPPERGLRFGCTMCGNCCSGSEGYVLFTAEEGAAIAARLGLSEGEFLDRYTHKTRHGRSFNEVKSAAGLDCVFLDRATVPGKAVCGIYEQRPAQCRTWPFWKSNLRSRAAWERAATSCPGINKGRLHGPEHIRLTRDRVEI